MTVAESLPRLNFRLPGDWWTTSLRDRDTAVSAASRLIRHRIGPQDDRAALRARLHHDFTVAIDEAMRGGAQQLFLAVQVAAGMPLPISITVYLPDVELVPAIGTRGDRVLDVLERGLDAVQAGPVGDLGEFERLEAAGTAGLRTVRVRQVESGRDDDRGEFDVLVADYWLAVPGRKRVLLVSFSSSFAALRDPLLRFFDAIMRQADWAATAEAADPIH